MKSVLVVCVGNICRSPVGERLLRAHLAEAGVKVDSAGLGAVVGHGADDMAAEVAGEHGLSLDGHVARQFTSEIGAGYDLILVMEPGHKAEVARRAPQLSGRTMLFDQWTGARGIPDPYRRSKEFHAAVFDQLHGAATAWAARWPGRNGK